jgi:hypothetical protein
MNVEKSKAEIHREFVRWVPPEYRPSAGAQNAAGWQHMLIVSDRLASQTNRRFEEDLNRRKQRKRRGIWFGFSR